MYNIVIVVEVVWIASCDPMDCTPPGSPVHGISQVKILEWVAIPFSRMYNITEIKMLDNLPSCMCLILSWETYRHFIFHNSPMRQVTLLLSLMRKPRLREMGTHAWSHSSKSQLKAWQRAEGTSRPSPRPTLFLVAHSKRHPHSSPTTSACSPHPSEGYRRLKGWTHVDMSRPQCSGHLLLFLCPTAVFVQVHTPSLMESMPAWTPARGGQPWPGPAHTARALMQWFHGLDWSRPSNYILQCDFRSCYFTSMGTVITA